MIKIFRLFLASFLLIQSFPSASYAAGERGLRYPFCLVIGHKPPASSSKCGYLDEHANWVIEPKFDGVEGWKSFPTGALPADIPLRVRTGMGWGYINPDGSWLIEQKFFASKPFAESGFARANASPFGKGGIINRSGEWVLPPKKWSFFTTPTSSGAYFAGERYKIGLRNLSSGWIVEPNFYSVAKKFEFGGAYACVNKIRKCGIIDESGKWLIEPKFKQLRNFTADGLAIAEKDGKFGMIDRTGEWMVQPKFAELLEFSESGTARARGEKNDFRWGYIDRKGNWVIEPRFHRAEDFDVNGMALVILNKRGKTGYINSSGEWIIKPEFAYGSGFNENGYATVAKETYGPVGLINREGKLILPMEHKSIVRIGNLFFIKAQNENVETWSYRDANGKILIEAVK